MIKKKKNQYSEVVTIEKAIIFVDKALRKGSPAWMEKTLWLAIKFKTWGISFTN